MAHRLTSYSSKALELRLIGCGTWVPLPCSMWESFRARGLSGVACIAWLILNPWTTTEALLILNVWSCHHDVPKQILFVVLATVVPLHVEDLSP